MMSISSGTNVINGHHVRIPESELTVKDTHAPENDARLDKALPHYDEYTTILRKHLGVVESELSRLKGSRSMDAGAIKRIDGTIEPGARENDMQAQEAKILRLSPWEWRDVKSERNVNPNLPILIASSKGHVSKGWRSTGRRTSRHGDKAADDNTSQNVEASFDLAYRLAINSRILLQLLEKCTGTDFPEDRNVWLRPFKYLVAYETEIRQALQEAETAFDQLNVEPKLSESSSLALNHDAVPRHGRREASADAVSYAKPISALDASRIRAERDQLRCLVDFMSSDMQDIFDVKRQVSNQTLEEVAFEHLWMVYKPGDLVYTMENVEDRSTYQAYRILHVTGGRPILDTLNTCRFHAITDRSWEDESETEDKARDTIQGSPSTTTPFIIDCFSIDFDGHRLGPKSRRFVIPKFTGKRRVNALEICPAFSRPQHEQIYRGLVERGRRFTQIANGTHKTYSGMTLRESREFEQSYFNYTIQDEEIHSEVMLDQSAAVAHFRKEIDRWRFKLGGRILGVPTTADRRETFDTFPVKRDESQLSDVLDDSIIDSDRRNDFLNSTTLLKHHRDILDPSISDKYIMLLPFRVYGFGMLNRKWYPLNINLVDDITPDEVRTAAAGYDDLVLPEGHKKLLQAVVKNQVRDPRKIDARRWEDSDQFQMDVVKGKGKGLIILLHGAPGVGKTSTAECVAAQLKRPLLPITCGDISTKVKQAEETLQEYCTLAHRWRCVLLLDEADVFLARREKGDIQRNGLVSVFLRVLEYFSGVIILTTNRVGEFDEAFRSRIHVSLYYPKLDQDATLQIWKRNLERLRKSDLQLDFSEDEIRAFAEQRWLDNEEKPSHHWNGRQIKNAFQTALALANWEFYETKKGQSLPRPLLTARHFKRVAQTSDDFDEYISRIFNMEDPYSVLASHHEIRSDKHPAMSAGRSNPQEHVPRSRRAAPSRRGADVRDSRAEEGRSFEGGGDNAKVRQLELELEIMKLKQASAKEEVGKQAQAGDDDEDEGF